MRIIYLFIFLTLTHCTAVPLIPAIIENQHNDVGQKQTKLIEPPYEVNGKWFYPQNYDFFQEVGIASKIKDLNNGDLTKISEHFHSDVMTASHRSLPLPSYVRVTNASTGKFANVRVNHRGAYSNTNVINLSEAAYEFLELNQNGDLVYIELIKENETFILSKAHTYEEEKKVLEAPVSDVQIIENNESLKKIDNQSLVDQTNYLVNFKPYERIFIKVAKISQRESANYVLEDLKSFNPQIIEQTNNSNKKNYMIVIGPFTDVKELMKVLKKDTFDKYEDLSIFLL